MSAVWIFWFAFYHISLLIVASFIVFGIINYYSKQD